MMRPPRSATAWARGALSFIVMIEPVQIRSAGWAAIDS
jgi:hypothetical protein